MKKARVILGFGVTVLLAVIGFGAYSSGTHYMTWFGIKLSQTGFTVLIGIFLLLDILALRSAATKGRELEQANTQAMEKAREGEKLEDGCTVSITRLSSFVGSAAGVHVYLNGVEQGILKNGKTLSFVTNAVQNELSVSYSADGTTRSIAFLATPGGQVSITLKYSGAVLTLQGGAGGSMAAQ